MNDFIVSLMLLGAIGSSDGQLPYWATANQYGLMPESTGALALVRARTEFEDSKTLQWRWGTSLAANGNLISGDRSNVGRQPYHLMADELYASLRWQCFTIDAGMKHRDQDFLASDESLGSLSVTGGHMIESGNSRTMPGYLITLEPLAVPFTGRHLWIYGSYGDYRTIDTRYVQDALVHRMKACIRADFNDRLSLHLGLDHYALWAGDSPDNPPIEFTLSNYWRIITGRSGGSGATLSDRINVLGDHGGSEIIRFEYKGDGWTAEFQHEIPYADRSGMKFRNFPDGVNTIHFGYGDKDRWVSDILYEYHYTMYQSGSINGEKYDSQGHPLHPEGTWIYGGDNYFNNSYYRSGWTHFGRVTGDPLFFPVGTKDGTWTSDKMVMGLENTRFKAHHFALGGKLWRKHPYKLMLTYSMNHGKYSKPYAGESQWQKEWGTVKETGLPQFSAAFTGSFHELFGVSGLSGMYGLYYDCGKILPSNFGLTLGVRYTL